MVEQTSSEKKKSSSGPPPKGFARITKTAGGKTTTQLVPTTPATPKGTAIIKTTSGGKTTSRRVSTGTGGQSTGTGGQSVASPEDLSGANLNMSVAPEPVTTSTSTPIEPTRVSTIEQVRTADPVVTEEPTRSQILPGNVPGGDRGGLFFVTPSEAQTIPREEKITRPVFELQSTTPADAVREGEFASTVRLQTFRTGLGSELGEQQIRSNVGQIESVRRAFGIEQQARVEVRGFRKQFLEDPASFEGQPGVVVTDVEGGRRFELTEEAFSGLPGVRRLRESTSPEGRIEFPDTTEFAKQQFKSLPAFSFGKPSRVSGGLAELRTGTLQTFEGLGRFTAEFPLQATTRVIKPGVPLSEQEEILPRSRLSRDIQSVPTGAVGTATKVILPLAFIGPGVVRNVRTLGLREGTVESLSGLQPLRVRTTGRSSIDISEGLLREGAVKSLSVKGLPGGKQLTKTAGGTQQDILDIGTAKLEVASVQLASPIRGRPGRFNIASVSNVNEPVLVSRVGLRGQTFEIVQQPSETALFGQTTPFVGKSQQIRGLRAPVFRGEAGEITGIGRIQRISPQLSLTKVEGQPGDLVRGFQQVGGEAFTGVRPTQTLQPLARGPRARLPREKGLGFRGLKLEDFVSGDSAGRIFRGKKLRLIDLDTGIKSAEPRGTKFFEFGRQDVGRSVTAQTGFRADIRTKGKVIDLERFPRVESTDAPDFPGGSDIKMFTGGRTRTPLSQTFQEQVKVEEIAPTVFEPLGRVARPPRTSTRLLKKRATQESQSALESKSVLDIQTTSFAPSLGLVPLTKTSLRQRQTPVTGLLESLSPAVRESEAFAVVPLQSQAQTPRLRTRQALQPQLDLEGGSPFTTPQRSKLGPVPIILPPLPGLPSGIPGGKQASIRTSRRFERTPSFGAIQLEEFGISTPFRGTALEETGLVERPRRKRRRGPIQPLGPFVI